MVPQFLTPEETAPPASSLVATEAATTPLETPAAVFTPAANDLVARVQQKILRRNRRYRTALLMTIITSIVLCLSSLLMLNSLAFWLGFWLMIGCVVLMLISVGVMLWNGLSPLGFDANEFTRLGDVRAVPGLIDAVSVASPRQQATLHAALTVLLPQMKASDAHLLTRKHRGLLLHYLAPLSTMMVDEEFVIAILKSLEQIGDAAAIPPVTRLANRKAATERDHHIQQAARDCLPLLQANVGVMDSTQTLLRAAESPAPDTLLRPAASAPATREDELLRIPDDP